MPTAELCRTEQERCVVLALLQRVAQTSPEGHSA